MTTPNSTSSIDKQLEKQLAEANIQGRIAMLDGIRASLEHWPHLGIDVEVAQSIDKIVQQAVANSRTERDKENEALRHVVEDYLVVNWDEFPKFDGTREVGREWVRILSRAVEMRKHEILDPLISAQALKAKVYEKALIDILQFTESETERISSEVHPLYKSWEVRELLVKINAKIRSESILAACEIYKRK